MAKKIVASYPAYDIVEAPIHTLSGLPILKDGDTLALKEKNHNGYVHYWVSGLVRN